jgi:signal peptidase I
MTDQKKGEGFSVGRMGKSLWREWIRPFLVIAVILGSLRSALADWNDVPTGSMKPTIVEGDRVFVNKLAYDLKVPFTTTRLAQWDDPKRGDIVVFFSPADGKRLVKRVIALPGDEVELRNEVVHINGVAMRYRGIHRDDPRLGYLTAAASTMFAEESAGASPHPIMISPDVPAMRTFAPMTVPNGQYFVLGDNRDDSYDSRFIGPIPRQLIIGKATAVAFSLDRSRWFLPRIGRFFRPLV